MRFKVAKQDLEAALQVVNPSLGSGADLTGHYVFHRTGPDDAGKYGVEVKTVSDRLFSSCPVKAQVEEAGTKDSFTIEGWRLKKVLHHIPDAALTIGFNADESEALLRVGRFTQTFQSLQPDARYTWSKPLAAATVAATVAADRLSQALGYARHFVSANDSEQPELCACEIREGIVYATDKRSISLIRVAGMDESKLRVHGKDASSLMTFLGMCEGLDVDVLEHDTMLILRRGDGAVFGAMRFQASMPNIQIGMDDGDQHRWTVLKQDLVSAIGLLTSGAAKEDNRLHLEMGADGDLLVSMLSATGKQTVMPLAVISKESDDEASDLPDGGFSVDHTNLAKVLSAWKDSEFTIGISLVSSRGYVRFTSEYEGDKYLTLFSWLY